MKTRMQPIGNIWNKFPRIVRDLALACGKQVRIEMEGEETELDKTLIEAIRDPLTHIVRNSIDHGIELPPQRLAAGKPAEGRLFLRALHESGQVIIEVADDGAGIDVERVRAKALERGLITSDQAAHMSEGETLKLVFLPGFSTAAEDHQHLRARRRDGCGQDQHRKNRRHRRYPEHARARHAAADQDSADARDHSRPDRYLRRRSLRDSADQPHRAGPARSRREGAARSS